MVSSIQAFQSKLMCICHDLVICTLQQILLRQYCQGGEAKQGKKHAWGRSGFLFVGELTGKGLIARLQTDRRSALKLILNSVNWILLAPVTDKGWILDKSDEPSRSVMCMGYLHEVHKYLLFHGVSKRLRQHFMNYNLTGYCQQT